MARWAWVKRNILGWGTLETGQVWTLTLCFGVHKTVGASPKLLPTFINEDGTLTRRMWLQKKTELKCSIICSLCQMSQIMEHFTVFLWKGSRVQWQKISRLFLYLNLLKLLFLKMFCTTISTHFHKNFKSFEVAYDSYCVISKSY